ncbi:MAG TPA: helix-turn-helix transcriptional regulator [Kribbella sp.]|nr:helix-turn-helix transcriptional regulator [Kribbella sp.]
MSDFPRLPPPLDPVAASQQVGRLAPPRSGPSPLPGYRVRQTAAEEAHNATAAELPVTLARQLDGMLAETLYEERKLSLLPQRILSTRTGVPQPKVSAYERGRITPSWETFVRLLMAMGRAPVLSTRSVRGADSVRDGSSEDRLFGALLEVVGLVGDRPYLIWHRAAAYLHGLAMTAERVILQGVAVHVVGDPDRLDDFARTLGDDRREVRTARGPQLSPHLTVLYDGIELNLFVMDEVGAAIDIGFGGQTFRVPPLDDVLVF